MSEVQPHVPVEDLEVFRLFEEVSEWIWHQVATWPKLAQDTIGRQFIRSADSINANLVEGDGRFHDRDAIHFFTIARGSAREARLWLKRATKRGLLEPTEAETQLAKLTRATKLLNLLINYRRKKSGLVREQVTSYSESV